MRFQKLVAHSSRKIGKNCSMWIHRSQEVSGHWDSELFAWKLKPSWILIWILVLLQVKSLHKPLLFSWQEVTWSLERAQDIFNHFGKLSAASCSAFVHKGTKETGDTSHHSTHSTMFHSRLYQNGILSLCLSNTIFAEIKYEKWGFLLS